MNTFDPTSESAAQSVPLTATDAAQTPRGPVASGLHTIGLLAFLGVWAYIGRGRAIHMRAQATPNHLLLYLPTIAVEWLLFAYVVFGVRRRGISLRELVGPRWSKGKENLIDLGVACAFELVALIVLSVTGHLLHTQSNAESLRFMAPVGALEMVLWVLLSLTAGICEETIFRGYLQRQFIGWTRNATVGVIISAAIFGACHIYQGGKQTIVIAIYGAMFGALAVLRRSLKPGMMAHAFQDTAAGIAISLAIKYKLGGM